MKTAELRARFQALTDEQKLDLLLELQAVVESKDDQIANLKELLRLRTAERYVPSSEQMQCLFPELEVLAGVLDGGGQEKSVRVASHQRTFRKKHPLVLPPDTPAVEVDHTVGEPDGFVEDGVEYVRAADKVIDKVARIPARFVVEHHHYAQYRTKDADDGGSNKKVRLGDEFAATACSPVLAAGIAVSKYDDHLPLYRQQEIFERQGVRITRQAAASWLVKLYGALAPLEKVFKETAYSSAFLAKDETPVTVLDVRSENGKVSRNGYAYITIGSTWDEASRKTRRIVLMEYIQGRSTAVLLEDMRRYGYKGPVLTDGLKGYLRMAPRPHAVCWVHAERAFKQILKAHPAEPNAARVVREAARLFAIEERLRPRLASGELGAGGFLAARRAEAEPVIDGIYGILDEIRGKYAPDGPMGKAIGYLDAYRGHMKVYLDYVEGEPSNNGCERRAKAFATGRKNWLFCQSVDGADASCFFYTLIETAKEAGISPSDYVEYVATFYPECRKDGRWERLLPWNADLSRLDGPRRARLEAVPDRGRTQPYVFPGNSR